MVGKRVNVALSLTGATDRLQRSRRSLFARWIAILLCLLWLTGCVSGILTRRGSQGVGGKAEPTAKLIKPRVAAGAKGDTAANDSRRDRAGKEGKQDDNVKETPPLPADNHARPISGDDGKHLKSQDVKTPEEAPLRSEEKAGGRSARGEGVEEKLRSGSQLRDYRPEDEGSFKKHNHVQYVELIEKKARQILKEHRDASLARMCKDSTTDQWTLNIYRRDHKTYSFISYTWDEVDEKWEKSFESRRQSISRWQNHLDFAAARKTCKVLKGD